MRMQRRLAHKRRVAKRKQFRVQFKKVSQERKALLTQLRIARYKKDSKKVCGDLFFLFIFSVVVVVIFFHLRMLSHSMEQVAELMPQWKKVNGQYRSMVKSRRDMRRKCVHYFFCSVGFTFEIKNES